MIKHSLHVPRLILERMEITLQVTIRGTPRTTHLTSKQVYCNSSWVLAAWPTLISLWTIWVPRTSKSTSSSCSTTLNRVSSMKIKKTLTKLVQRTKLVCPTIANSLLNAMLMTYIIHKVINNNKTFKISNLLQSHSINSKAYAVSSQLTAIKTARILKVSRIQNIKNNSYRQLPKYSRRLWISWRWSFNSCRIWDLIHQTLARCCKILHWQRALRH